MTCAVYKGDAYKYHSSIEKTLGEYFELELKNSEDEIFTFVFKRTMHNSEGINLRPNKVIKKLKDSEPVGIVTLESAETN